MRLAALLLIAVSCFGQITWTVNSTNLATLSYGGQSLIASGSKVPVDWLAWTRSGVCPAFNTTGWHFQPSATKTTDSSTYWQYVWANLDGAGVDQATMKVTYTNPDANTIKATIELTNDDATNSMCFVSAYPFPVNWPSNDADGTNAPQTTNPHTNGFIRAHGSWGTAFLWTDFSYTGVNIATSNWTSGDYRLGITNYYQTGVTNPANASFTTDYVHVVPPSTKYTYAIYLRLLPNDADTITNVSEAIAGWQAAQPAGYYNQTVGTPNRTTIFRWFTADTTRRTATNPRGYYNGSINVTGDWAGFRNTMLYEANAAADRCVNVGKLHCQGILIWDIEGQELDHATTYIGDPSKLAEFSPEMATVTNGRMLAQEIADIIRSKGLKVMFTLRPAKITTGTSLPATCTYNAAYDLRELFLDTDTPGRNATGRIYECASNGTSWTDKSPNGPNYQTTAFSKEEIVTMLTDRIAYIKRVFGASGAYIDSVTYPGTGPYAREIWQQVRAAAGPDFYLFPEFEQASTFEFTGPYTTYAASEDAAYTSSLTRAYVPGAFRCIQGADGNAITQQSYYVRGRQQGDIYLANGWFDSNNALVDQPAADVVADTAMSCVTMTDSNVSRDRSWCDNPGTAYTYRLVLRVKFASSSGGLEASTTYCEMREAARCYLSGTQQSTATLNLGTMTHYRKDLVTFDGTTMIKGRAETLP